MYPKHPKYPMVMGMGICYENPMGIDAGMGMDFENGYGCGYISTHTEPAPCPSLVNKHIMRTPKKSV